MKQQMYLRTNISQRRRPWCNNIIFYFVVASIQLIEIVSGFNIQPKRVTPITACRYTTIDRDLWYKTTCWSIKNRRRAFMKIQRNRQQQLLQHQMHPSDVATNSTSSPSNSVTPTVTRLSNTRIYDLGTGKHPPLNSSTGSATDTTISSLLSSVTDDQKTDDQTVYKRTYFEVDKGSSSTASNTTAMNVRWNDLHWMAPESVVKPPYAIKKSGTRSIRSTTTNDDNVVQPDPSLQNQKQRIKIEKKSRRMVAYVLSTVTR